MVNVTPGGGGLKKVVIESFILKIYSQTLIHPITKQVFMNETLTFFVKNNFVQMYIFVKFTKAMNHLSEPLVCKLFCLLFLFRIVG